MSHYIDPRGKPFAHLDRLAAWQGGRRPAPATIEWDLTNVCSLGCQSCHMAHTHVAGPWAGRASRATTYTDTGRHADAELVERALGEVAAVGVRAIVWSGGGEPTLHPAVGSIITLAHRYGLEQGLYTLGGHITPLLAETIGPALSWVVVSLDAPDAETYAAEKRVPAARFEAACGGVRLLTDTCPVVGVSFLLHAGNYTRTAEMLARARDLGATYTTFRPTIETRHDDPARLQGDRWWIDPALAALERLITEPDVEVDLQRFREVREWVGHGYTTCFGVRLLTQITPDGRVWVCPNRRGLVGSEIGDLRRETFAAIWARHAGAVAVDRDCRAMCRLHLANQTLATVYHPRLHEGFV